MQNKIILHVGLHKTGTTTLQKYLMSYNQRQSYRLFSNRMPSFFNSIEAEGFSKDLTNYFCINEDDHSSQLKKLLKNNNPTQINDIYSYLLRDFGEDSFKKIHNSMLETILVSKITE